MTDERAALAARHRPEPIGSDPDNEVDAGDWFADERATLITTEAGKRLREWFMQEERAAWLLPHIDGHIAAIEAEARADVRARLRERVEGLGATVVTNAKWDARGVLTIEHDSLGTGTQMLDRAAVLAILEEETK